MAAFRQCVTSPLPEKLTVMSVLRGLALSSFLAGVIGASSIACGNATPDNRDYGEPPDVVGFNPGSGGNDPYGGYASGPSVVECPDELKRCAHTITYPDTGQREVELRGDWGGQATWEAGKQMTKKGGLWTVDIDIPYGRPIQYKFIVDGTWTVDEAQPTSGEGGLRNNTFAGKTCEQSTCEEEGELPPGVFDWRDSVIYFVFVDRFHNGNTSLDAACKVSGVTAPIADYQGGDWAGVTQKINEGYFNDLGVNTLWLTVPFENFGGKGVGWTGNPSAPNGLWFSGSHGYWPLLNNEDPTQLEHESCFGSFDDLKALIAAAHAKGLKVLFDFAMVHVHSESRIYQQHNDWFWPNSKAGAPNCVCGSGCSWDTDTERCWFTDYLPHWNYTNPAARQWSVDNAVAWVKKTVDAAGNGVDGFRADAIKHVDLSWLTALRAKLKTDVTAQQSPQQRFYMVGETYDFGNRDILKRYIDPATKLDGQFDFPLRRHVVDATIMRKMKMSDLASFMDTNDYFYGAGAVMSTFIGNHDLPRIIHLATGTPLWDDQGNDGKDRAWSNQPALVTEPEAYERVANGFSVLLTNRGAPLIYYGDEIGLPGAGDPDNRRFMQWGGYTAEQATLKSRIKRLLEIRSKHPALRRGTRATVISDNETWLYSRTSGKDKVWVAINRADIPKQISGLPSGALDELIAQRQEAGPTVTVPPRQTRIYVQR
jgi:glycosidase